MSVRKRFLHGFGASALGPLVTIVAQIISVPVFLRAWGTVLYGEWLILAAIPTYIAFSDIGFGNVAANDMTMRVAAGDRNGALETFQSSWLLISSCSLAIGALFVAAAWLLPLCHWLNLNAMGPANTRVVLALLCGYALLSLQADLITSGFRCEGRYALGMLLKNLLRLAETFAVTAMVMFSRSPIEAAVAYLVTRALGTVVMAVIMVRQSPWLGYGSRHARWSCSRRLLAPAVAYMAFPAGSALSLQGMVLVIGAVLGPIAVVTFSTMRTLTRFGFQIMESVKNSVWPELSAAYGARNWPLARRLHRVACQASLWSSLFSVSFLFFFGERIITLWTHGRVTADPTAFRWLLLAIAANSFWYTSSVVTVASNQHQRVAACYLVGTAASLLLARLFLPHFGISGAAMALLAIDLIVGWYVLSQSLSTLKEGIRDFGASLFRFPELSFKR
ncbi:MAG TPA: lipopolysaccharide biosynthesis protein [Terriglobales bacterium]|jgi:O-antigen/teichoic acid export membrane protein|nr:lipopolysaccharide biosynthesis protein [Terriglobales bacterium]